ncbi:hypothetical protein [Aestuariivivens sediminicola]|uniref:hypothetical protein n=1 Tax=Aestuariivivens sediminicola TaxID=2913560 RepID=UPI001F5ABBBA|nr:hypothetical protein [Aestuariivivens sediminicola]
MITIKTHPKTLAIIIFGMLLFPINMNAQTKTKKIRTYKVWITMLDGSEEKGMLYSADEEFLKISKSNTLDESNVTAIHAGTIDVIKIRRKGKVGKGALIGGLSGIGASVLIGATTDDDNFFTREESAAIAGIVLVPLGTGIGALTGTKRELIPVNGNLKNYLRWLTTIQSYSLKSNANE